MVAIDRLVPSVNIATYDVCRDNTTDWNDYSVNGVMTKYDRAIMGMFSNTKSSILTKEILSFRWDVGLESTK